MHRAFRKALEDAQGTSEFMFVVFADIRGFSAFSQRQESPDVAMYIKRVYIRLIDDYFRFASFYKPTGDGLLITVPFNEPPHLQQRAQTTVSACLRCLQDFPSICADDPMINFQPPTQIGFGLARGTACCLMSRRRVLDYSGHVLNLASRLKDLARPSGIVLDESFGIELLSEEQQALFAPTEVYLRSVAEEEPRNVYFLKNVVEIPEQASRPLRFEQWETIEEVRTFAEWRAVPTHWSVDLPKRLRRPDGLAATLTYPLLRRGERTGLQRRRTLHEVRYWLWANRPMVLLAVQEICAYLRQRRVPLKTPVTVIVAYVPE